jgi:hypothetical protein
MKIKVKQKDEEKKQSSNQIELNENMALPVIKKLLSENIIGINQVEKVESILISFLSSLLPLNFANDTEFLKECIDYNVRMYFKEILEPEAARFFSNKTYGRFMNDEDLKKSTKIVTEHVLEELGDNYKRRLSIYFGEEEPFITYVFKRIKEQLLLGINEFNKSFYKRINYKTTIKENENLQEPNTRSEE